MAKIKRIGILTAGGDSPGLNAAIRGVGKTALGFYGMEIIGFRDGFRGLVEDRRLKLDKSTLAGILTVGGTILGTSRDKPHRMVIDGRTRDMTDVIVENYDKYGLDCARLPRRRRHAKKRAAPASGRTERHHAAQDD